MKKNQKGFTLIELLAVIIILGILMIIAIPSVTTYIQNSRKSAYVDTASAYIDAVRTKVNEGKDLKLFSTDTLYLIPVGNDDTKTCVSVESGGKSPFSDTWRFAYVGVTYTGEGYKYYYISEDGANQGLSLITQDELSKNGNDHIYSSYSDSVAAPMTQSFATSLAAKYGTREVARALTEDEQTAFEMAIEKSTDTSTNPATVTYGKSKIVYVGSTGDNKCKFTDSDTE